MLTCRDISELVTDYQERALPLRQRLGVRLHLFLCAACRRYFDQMHKTVALLSRRPPLAPSAEREDRLIAAINPAAPPPGDR